MHLANLSSMIGYGYAVFLLCILPVNTYQPASDKTLKALPWSPEDFDIHNGSILAPILTPRVPGTAGSARVRKHFLNHFAKLPHWRTELQPFTSYTPRSAVDETQFTNVIATRDPPWATDGDTGRLTLTAHYDSKAEPDGFIGAIDSAAPCAMLLHAAQSIDDALTRKWARMLEEGDTPAVSQGVQIVFFDGEEAFDEWTRDDSLYGSRELAAKWARTTYPAGSEYESRVKAIDLFVLLDLLGSPNPQVRSSFKSGHPWYEKMAVLQGRLEHLRDNGVLEGLEEKVADASWFVDGERTVEQLSGYRLEDDWKPFWRYHVDILHLVDTNSSNHMKPKVWHTLDDDGEHLDMKAVERWSLLVTAFVVEWMELEGFI